MKKTLLEKLLNRIEIDEKTDCWIFTGPVNNIGYGMMRDENKMRTTHRVSYEEHNQVKIPPGMCVCHTCDNTRCVNPSHLWLGTRKQNTEDMIRKGRDNFTGGYKRKGQKQPRTVCPHCSKSVPNPVFNRWHNNNCRFKTDE